MATIAQWDINNECNLNCKHCRVSEKNDNEKMSLNEAKNLLAQCWYNGITMLNLSGGEPFLRKDIFDILDYAGKFEDIVITTNGTLLDENKCKKLSTYNNIKLSISLDGLEETHDKFRRRKGAFKKVIDTLPLLNKYNIKYTNIKRTTSYHGCEIKNNISSASNIRKMSADNQDIANLIPFDKKYLYKVSMNNYLDILKYKVLSEDININKYQTVDEGIEGRIIDNITKVTTYEELIQNIKTKRYTYNKISRMLLHILTSFTKEEASNIDIDYIRVLGFTTKGQEYLSKIKKNITIPIITGYKKNISKVLDIEYRVTKIYSLFTSNNLIKKEYQIKPIIKENND